MVAFSFLFFSGRNDVIPLGASAPSALARVRVRVRATASESGEEGKGSLSVYFSLSLVSFLLFFSFFLFRLGV